MITVNIGDTDENADWIKTPENRASEQAIHDELARRIEEEVVDEKKSKKLVVIM
jgi:hypothetical protein